MTIGEQRALLVLALIIAAGLGTQSWRESRERGPLYIEYGENPATDSAEAIEAQPPFDSAPIVQSPEPPPRASALDNHGRLDLNRATAEELMEHLPGIGETRAQSIVDYRRANGPFGAVDDLQNIYGIGEKTVARVRPLAFAGTARPSEKAP